MVYSLSSEGFTGFLPSTVSNLYDITIFQPYLQPYFFFISSLHKNIKVYIKTSGDSSNQTAGGLAASAMPLVAAVEVPWQPVKPRSFENLEAEKPKPKLAIIVANLLICVTDVTV